MEDVPLYNKTECRVKVDSATQSWGTRRPQGLPMTHVGLVGDWGKKTEFCSEKYGNFEQQWGMPMYTVSNEISRVKMTRNDRKGMYVAGVRQVEHTERTPRAMFGMSPGQLSA